MVEEKKLESYSKRYEEVKGEIVESTILKGDLERQKENSENEIEKLTKNIMDIKANIFSEVNDKILTRIKELKNHLIINLVVNLLYGILLFALLHSLIKISFLLSFFSSSFAVLALSGSDIKDYFKTSKKMEFFKDYDICVLENERISNLLEKYNIELSKNKDIQNCLDIVNEKLYSLGEIKLDIENLIICLFSSLDNIIKNQSNQKEPFKTWLNISYEEDKPKLEISSTMKRVRNKKEDK